MPKKKFKPGDVVTFIESDDPFRINLEKVFKGVTFTLIEKPEEANSNNGVWIKVGTAPRCIPTKWLRHK